MVDKLKAEQPSACRPLHWGGAQKVEEEMLKEIFYTNQKKYLKEPKIEILQTHFEKYFSGN